jgi:hypothetical protein
LRREASASPEGILDTVLLARHWPRLHLRRRGMYRWARTRATAWCQKVVRDPVEDDANQADYDDRRHHLLVVEAVARIEDEEA